ncbi:MAG TPA: hypothetical protein VMC08_10260, partial [Bacteroidales bacterium]|nr:hypothetical protein [Bacteroidales bacterium]
IAIAVLIFLPNVLWQLTHRLPVLYHMNALASRQLVHVDRMSILTDLVVFSGPGFLLFIPGLLFLLISNRLKSYRMFAWVAIFVVGILVALKGKSYYAVGILPFLMAAGGIFLEKVLKKTFSRVFTVALITIVGLLLLPAGVPVFGPAGLEKYFRILTSVIKNTDILRFEDGQIHPLPQDYSDMIGWNELTQVTAELYRSLPDKQSTRIYAENYGEAGAINVIGRQYGLPQPLCFAESFLYWNPREFPVEIKTLIYINEERPGKDVYEMFEEVTPMGSITQPLSREYGTTVYLCTHPRKSFNAAWKDLVNMRKNPFR